MNAACTREERVSVSDTAMKTKQKLRVIEESKSSQLSADGAKTDDRQRALVVEASQLNEKCWMH